MSDQRDAARFHNVVETTRERIAARLETYVALLRATAALHAASEGELSRARLRSFVGRLDLPTRYPGIQGIGFSKRVGEQDQEALITRARAEGFSEFRIWPREGGENVTTILYLEPLDFRNMAALGFDMYTESTRQAAMRKAWHTGAPAMSGRVTLKQEIHARKQAGFLIYVPVYRTGRVPETEAERQRELDGFVYSPFRADDLFRGIFGAESAPNVIFRAYDQERRDDTQMHDSGSFTGDSVDRSAFRRTVPLEVAGRTWVLDIGSSHAFEQASIVYSSRVVAGTGLLASFAFFLLARSQSAGRLQAEQRERRGRLLLEVEDLLRRLVEPERMIEECVRRLGEHTDVQRCAYGALDDDSRTLRLGTEYTRGGALTRGSKTRFLDVNASGLDDAPDSLLVIHDTERDARLDTDERETYKRERVRSLVAAPFRRRGRVVACMVLEDSVPRSWSQEELVVASSVASRCWEAVERARSQRELQLSEARFRNMADHAPVMLWISDASGAYTYVNRPWCTFTGRASEEALGARWLHAVHSQDVASLEEHFRAANSGGSEFRAEYRLRRSDGEYRWVSAAAAPRFGSSGEFLGYIGSILDIEDRRRSELEREQLLLKAEEGVRVRDEFLAIASHELKTPITALVLQVDGLSRQLLASRGGASGESSKLTAIARQVSRLTALVDELLDVSRISSGRLTIRSERVDLVALVRDTVMRLSPMFERARCPIRFAAPDRIELWVDPVRTQQILDNLLENAAKYGPGKPVEIEVRLDATSVNLTVRDGGIGIAPEDQSRIFQRFERAVPLQNYGGLGLGLWIARQLAEAMDGSIEVQSRPGKGAAFTVRLPLRLARSIAEGRIS